MTATGIQDKDTNRNHSVPAGTIRLRGVRVNNLKNIDLDIPHGQMLALCGLSGSGKTSLALETLFAEGQRRYIECFSPYTRQFLDQLEKPEADQIDGIPPAIAVKASRRSTGARSTVGSVTETIEYLRLLFARCSRIVCPHCGIPVARHSPQQIVPRLQGPSPGRRFQIAWPASWENAEQREALISDIRRNGFRRVIAGDRLWETDHLPESGLAAQERAEVLVVVDRLNTSGLQAARCTESLETAFFYGHGTVVVLIETGPSDGGPPVISLEGRRFEKHVYSQQAICGSCQRVFPDPDVGLFSFNSPQGACPTCEGFGSVHHLDMDKIVPDRTKSVREGAIVPWNSPAYRHELEELIAIADEHDFPLDVPFSDLSRSDIDFLWRGDRDRDFGGLNGFFRWLEKRKYKMHLRIFLARWRSYETCPQCQGQRLNDTALSFQIDGLSIAGFSQCSITEMAERMTGLQTDPEFGEAAGELLRKILERLGYLQDVGVGYLTLGRQLRTLGSGERQRVELTRALGSSLVNLLYVLDEPSAGLHPDDLQRLKPQIHKLQQRKNTVVVVDHDPEIINMADRIVEIGPQAGRHGGQIVFDGSPDEIVSEPRTVTGEFLAGLRGGSFSSRRRDPRRGKLQIFGARGNNLANINVSFPLGVLCVVSGVSGAGKSTLVRHTLAPAVARELHDATDVALEFDELHGAARVDQVAVIDQTALPKMSRSNPATYVKAWDEIRKVFAATPDAKTRNFKPGHFSFNVEGGRCESCSGDGYLTIDMQFMADILRRCEHCQGTRFKAEVCQVRYRNRNISDVLQMTGNEAFGFFRGHPRVQKRLKLLRDVGLGYLQIGQPASTLSSGEAQRLKLAAFLGRGGQKRTLFLMDEPTAGLHMADVVRLIDCFAALLDVGHSMIVIEHNRQMLAHADHIVDLGPGPAEAGGTVVATGTPEEICENEKSITGRYLKPVLQSAWS